MLEQGIEESVRRLSNKRIDPFTGNEYNTEINPPRSEEVANRLVTRKEDDSSIVKKRYNIWSQNVSMLEDNYKNVLLPTGSDKSVETVMENIHSAIENPIFWVYFPNKVR